MIKENLYKILGLPNFSPMAEIKKAYRALAMTHHPDRGGDMETMKKINAAYQILSEKKSEYNARLCGGFMPRVIIRHQSHGWARDTTNNSTTVFMWYFSG